MRRLAIMTLQRAAGRAGEAGWLNFDNLCWDVRFSAVFDVLQTKTAKLKKVQPMVV